MRILPRDGSNIWSPPAGTTATPGTAIESAKYNALVADITVDLNAPRPIVAGGTGASTAGQALVNLGLTATAAELNYTDGVTSPIQTQLNTLSSGKQAAGATLTSLEGLSLVAGDILYATAADTLQRLPKGTAGQALVMNTGATAPEWTTGGRVLLASKTASASATMDFTEFNIAVYRYYEFELESVKPATDATDLFVRFSSNGGSSYDAGGTDYAIAGYGIASGGALSSIESGGTNSIPLTTAGNLGNAAAEFGVSGTLKLLNAGNALQYTRLMFQVSTDTTTTAITTYSGTARRNLAQDTDGVRFFMASGNIATGVIRMYGLN